MTQVTREEAVKTERRVDVMVARLKVKGLSIVNEQKVIIDFIVIIFLIILYIMMVSSEENFVCTVPFFSSSF